MYCNKYWILFGFRIILLISDVKSNPPSTAANETNDQIKLTLDLLKEGESQIQLSNDYKDVVFLLGNTGAGKSTFTQWFVQDSAKLTAKEVGDATGEYTIEDDNTKIGDSTITSKTIFPELVVDSKTNTAYYDCPGFSDTRSTSNDIATTYFIKKVADHAERVKLIIIISYPSLRKGVDRQDFMKLVRHITDLVKDIDKYRNSIAIVVTKVDNQYVKRGKNLVLVKDDKVIQTIADFLKQTKQDLVDDAIGSKSIPAKKQKLYENAIKFIDSILERDNDEKYSKIGIFRRPDEPGPLTNSVSLQHGRTHIASTIQQKLDFTAKSDDDFGYTVSEKSKNDINDLVEEINEDVSLVISNIAKEVQEYYGDLVESVNSKMNDFINSTTVVSAEESEAQLFLSTFYNGYDVLSSLLKELENSTNIEELADKIISSFNSTIINVSPDTMTNIKTRGKYLNFLHLVSDKEIRVKPWIHLFQSAETYFHITNQSLHNDISKTEKKINQKVTSYITSMTCRVKDHYQNKIKSLIIQKLPDKLSSAHNATQNVVQKIQQGSNLQILSEILGEKLAKLNINDYEIRTSLFKIFNAGKYLNFLQTLTKEELSTWSTEWVTPFRETTKYFYELEKWYQFLNDLYAKFSEYEVQINTSRYNVANIENWGDSSKTQGIMVTPSNFKNFLNKLKEFHIAEYDIIKALQITELQFQELNQILNITVKQRVVAEYPAPDKLVIKGDYIKFSDFLENDGKLKNSYGGESKLISINIFAFNTVFIDTDLRAVGDKLQVTVIAPKWQILGSREINLDGAPGGKHFPSKTYSGEYLGSDGQTGKPGLPGGSAGSFLGLGDEFIDSANLKITANGGNGGPGQHGGDGALGSSGKDATYPSNNCHIWGDYREINSEWYINPGILLTYTGKYYYYRIYGAAGGIGGSGGNGGTGGIGGENGHVNIIELTHKSAMSLSTRKGYNGIGGKGGYGGAGGKGRDITAKCYSNRILIGVPVGSYRLENAYYSGTSEASRGHNGIDNYNSINTELAESPATIQDPVKIYNNYKNYLTENLNEDNTRFKQHPFTKFFDQLNNNVNILSLYDTLALVQELRDLEELPQQLHKDNLIYFYQSLLRRISEYAKAPKESETSTQCKMVLRYLYTATLSKIYNLKVSSETNLVIDVTKYLDVVKQNIDTLKHVQQKTNKISVINEYKANYKTGIDKKIEEATILIKTQIIPEIDHISAHMDDHIHSLIVEVSTLKDQTREEKQELIRKKAKLEKALVFRGFFRVLNAVGHVASFFGPIGTNVASVIGATTSITETFASTDETGEQKVSHIPASVMSTLKLIVDQIEAFHHRKAETFNILLENLSQEIFNYPEYLNDTSVKITDMRKKCKTALDAGKLEYTQLEQLENELKTELTRKEEELKRQKNFADQKFAQAKGIIRKLKQTSQLAAIGFDVYNQHKFDQLKLDTANDPIRQAEVNLQGLKEFEHQIHSSIIPTLRNMTDSLKDTANKLGEKSQAVLDITKWKVQGILNDMTQQMRQLTNGFQVQDNVAHSLEKLQDVMITLINVYDRVQNYQEQQNLANYIADISSVDIVSVTDPKLNDALNHLEVIIRSNLILQQYRTAIGALKQWVFPFADLYLEQITLPSHLQYQSNIENLVSNAVTQTEHIKSKIEMYNKASITGVDKYIHIGEFRSGYISARPFFVWENTHHKRMFGKLLSGEKVLVKADITQSPPDKDAIKFNVIALDFKSKNTTIQTEINNILKGFKISLTHLGNSYYRYGEKIYVITSASQTVQYSFERNNTTGDPIYKNNVCEKLKTGNLMLSPYAVWRIELINVTNKASFNQLQMYKDDIYLELVGHGTYVTKDIEIPSSLVEAQYKVYSSNSESKEIDTNNPVRNKRDISKINRTELTNTSSMPNSWFSWSIRSPDFGNPSEPDTTVIEGSDLKIQKKYLETNSKDQSRSVNRVGLQEQRALLLNSDSMPSVNGIKPVESKILSTLSKL